MRERKFRAWFQTREDTEQKYSGMYDVLAIDFGSRVIQVARGSIFCQQIFPFDDIELLEYIGLRDKNGKEGCHKDLVKGEHSIYSIEWDEEETGFFLKNQKGLTGLKRQNIIDHFISLLKEMEIIGDAYSNPELLKE